MLEFDTQNINLGLERVAEVLHRLGDPHKKFKSLHVAGTNGKGSVCAMLDSILREDGYRVGLYTSPHLFKFNERIKVQGDDIPDERLEKGIHKIKWIAGDIKLTTFEILTCAAFDYFAECGVEIAVVEVGLGGRLDATNVITPKVSVITNIELDHTEYLGDTITKIAREKAGIIKRRVPVVTGERKKSALSIIRKSCQASKSRIYAVKNPRRKGTISGLLGPHQRLNEAIAIRVAKLLRVSTRKIASGLKKVLWPGRFEVISEDPVTIVDGAHNPAGARALLETIREMKLKKPYTLILGIQEYKDLEQLLMIIARNAEHVIVTRSSHPQAAQPDHLVSKLNARSHQKVMLLHSPEEALAVARGLGKPTIATGSLFLVADIKKLT